MVNDGFYPWPLSCWGTRPPISAAQLVGRNKAKRSGHLRVFADSNPVSRAQLYRFCRRGDSFPYRQIAQPAEQ